MILYYLGRPVEPVDTDVPNKEGNTAESFGAGHCNARWLAKDKQKDEIFTFWYSQLHSIPWGHQ